MSRRIKFGTSGWRGIIADEFTFDGVRIVTKAIGEHIISQGLEDKGVVIGYDTRFFSEDFAMESAKILASMGIRSYLSKRDVPTPVISFTVIHEGLAGGINFTASHNPYKYNGLKFSSSWGGPALPETTEDIEKRANAILEKGEVIRGIPLIEAKNKGLIIEKDLRSQYIRDLKKKVDLNLIKKARLKVGIDLLYGTGRGYLDEILEDSCAMLKSIHASRDVMFNNGAPEPSMENLRELGEIVRRSGCHIGLSVDGDADRFGIVDSDGTYINPNYILAILLDYLLKTREWKGGVARSVATTHLIDRVARKYGLEVYETGVGFKYIGDFLVKGKICFGGEESAGLTIKDHLPEKDGILACLLVAEMKAFYKKKTLKEIIRELMNDIGSVITKRINIHLTEENKDIVMKNIENSITELGGLRVKESVRHKDGTKYIFEDMSWLLMRPSGTEPVVRVYLESDRLSKLKKMEEAIRDFLFSV